MNNKKEKQIEFGMRVKKLRTQNGLSQEQLAHAIGYSSRASVNKIEDGSRDVSTDMVTKLAEALHTTPQYLLGWSGNDPRSELIKALESAPDEIVNDILNYTRFVLSQHKP